MVSTLTFPLGMYASDLFSPKLAIAIGGVTSIGATLIAISQTNSHTFFLMYSIGFGFGKGFLYPAALYGAWSHLPGRKGFVSGFVVSGMGLGAFIYGMVARVIVNPHNIAPIAEEVEIDIYENYFPSEVNANTPKMFYVMSICWTGQLVLAFLLISKFEAAQPTLTS
eukprot:CAMPEP_0170551988 /NCGR_PEP_ID=MMETSP0211-20121228/9972_1 /TAXON_ID=311385 /ORGANISM="Pseudokeronopsis sp., Strain OXSARD2" /LENGTH=166 /DNA_ID=CAMNT_0010859493 /DNA_START=162 /DNA_END=662 /DNA_ORIENTATION=+